MNYKDILENSTGVLGKYFCKGYYNLARQEFSKRNNRQATISDAQEIRDIYESQWHDYYIGKPEREKANREKSIEVWRHGIKYKVDVYNAMCRFLEYKYSEFKEHQQPVSDYHFNRIVGKYGYHIQSCADLMKEKNIEFLDGHIIDNGMLEEWKVFIDKHHKILPKHFKSTFADYSHLAYSGVSEDL